MEPVTAHTILITELKPIKINKKERSERIQFAFMALTAILKLSEMFTKSAPYFVVLSLSTTLTLKESSL